MDNVKIEFTFLHVEEGTTTTVTVPVDADRVEIARILRSYLSDGKTVMTEVNMTEYGYVDDSYDIVREMTDGDPLADLTKDDAVRLIQEARNRGYDIPPVLDPDMFLAIYYDLQNKED